VSFFQNIISKKVPIFSIKTKSKEKQESQKELGRLPHRAEEIKKKNRK